jgi:ligand-binding sensor domain-containing protein
MKLSAWLIILFFVRLVTDGLCMAQPDESQFRLLTKENGLSDNRITAIVQDEKGFLWVSTVNGLNRFDGVRFTSFMAGHSVDAIPDNGIATLHYFGNGCLALATEAGAQLINTNNHLERTNLIVPTDTSLYYWSNHVRDISKTAGNHFLVSTKTGLFVFDSHGKILQRYDRYTVQDAGKAWMIFSALNNTLPDSSVLAQVEDGFMHYTPSSNKMVRLTASPAGLGRLAADYKKSSIFFQRYHGPRFLYTDTKTNHLVVFNYTTGHEFRLPLPFKVVTEIGWRSRVSPLTDSSFAITGYYKGFFILTWHRATDTYSLSRKYFPDYTCTAVFADSEQRLWIGAREGLLMQKSVARQVETVQLSDAVRKGKACTIADITSWKNNLYATIVQSGDILVLDKQTMQPQRVIELTKHHPDIGLAFSLLPIHADTLWIGTNKGLRWLHPATGRTGRINNGTYPAALDSIDIYRYLRDSRGNYWFETGHVNTVLFYNTIQKWFRLVNADGSDPFFKINKSFGMAEDSAGHIWIAGDGLCRMNRHTFTCDTLIKYFAGTNPFKPAMSALNAGNNSAIWIKTHSSLLQWYPYAQKRLLFTAQNGLHHVSRFITGAGNYIAMLHSDGLSIFDAKSYVSKNYFTYNGLGNPLSYFYLRYDAPGQAVYATGMNVISRIPVTAIPGPTKPPSFIITALQTGNDTMIHYPGESQQLSYDQNDISIRFTAINYTAAANLRYAYSMLKNGDTAWTDLGNQSVLNFNNLSPGTYNLLVKVYSGSNEWKEVIRPLNIHISAPWWRQAWFTAVVLLAAITLVIFLYKRRITAIRNKAELNHRLVEYEMKALHAQMNPHFIFNCLNSIKYMIIKDDKDQASVYLTKFSRMIRQTLEQSRQGIVTIQKEKEYLADYLDMEKLRFDHSFQYDIRIASDINPAITQIPAMLVQPITENAIWHGLMHKAGEKKLTIQFYREQANLVCLIEDNGVGFLQGAGQPKNGHRSSGLDNIKKRIELLNQKHHAAFNMHIAERMGGKGRTGTCVKLIFDEGAEQ